ncbi:NADH dehydrogenase [ubiquinone] 1 alpha subcomplex subunit 11 [Perognathus longimembris pacificus]|uniref:NADH dehydrogenase [ubiquinone] 1 alpha subcomplex subunit 11 n=1 Tax=Perognathus longimembris pacificus TaxID=214514 RepID=UPI0020196BFA|nr:NADH dehydrogenase [ubiquinone] 1 alpha subcomplex subunit 11 [Perognathus longimembris pacificus]
MASSLLRQYWAAPDGTECHRKAYITTTLGAGAGLAAGSYSVIFWSASTSMENVARIGRYTFTAAAVGAMFGLASCISSQVREKPDDPLNYFIGGCAGGLTLGARTHSYGTAATGCLCMGVAAALLKMGRLEGWELVADRKV